MSVRPITVILDNGHGNDTPGKRSPIWIDMAQLFEWEFNRDVVNRIAYRLSKAGIVNTRLVPEKHDISLAERVRRCNAMVSAANRDGDQCVLISVHANAGGGTGWEVYTSPGKTRSDDLADMMLAQADRHLPQFLKRKDLTDGDGDKEAPFYLLTRSLCPAVLTENLFMDTWKDCKYLLGSDGRDKIADMHVEAIKTYARKYGTYGG